MEKTNPNAVEIQAIKALNNYEIINAAGEKVSAETKNFSYYRQFVCANKRNDTG